jgi:hypothetical protein
LIVYKESHQQSGIKVMGRRMPTADPDGHIIAFKIKIKDNEKVSINEFEDYKMVSELYGTV